MSNVFTKAKQLRKKHPGKSWQQLVKLASKQGIAKPKRKPAKRKKVGAYKVVEQGESRSTPARKVYRAKRSKTGTFKGMVSISGVKKFHEQKLQTALWNHEKATTVKATKAAAAEIRKHRAALKKL
jgi:hypothetical protein